MPPLDEGDILYMPTTLPNISIEEARASSSGRTRSCEASPRWLGAGQGRARGDAHRPGAAVDGRDRGAPQAPRAVAHQVRAALVRRAHAASCARCSPPVARVRADDPGGAGRRDRPPSSSSRAGPTPSPSPSATGSTCSPPASARPSASRCTRTTSRDRAGGHGAGARLHGVPGTRSVLFERSTGGYVDVVPDRDAPGAVRPAGRRRERGGRDRAGRLARDHHLDGRRRFTVNVRFAQDFRTSLEALGVRWRSMGAAAGDGGGRDGADGAGRGRARVAGAPATRHPVTSGPPMIRDEAGMLVGYVYVDVEASRDVGRYVDRARRPPSTRGQREGGADACPPAVPKWTRPVRAAGGDGARMKVLVPIALC
jgi:Cu(I)/Ag(I) efflux system membrane protein CusA/SilA